MGFDDAFIRLRLSAITPRRVTFPKEGVRIRELREDDFLAASRLVAEMGAHRSPLPDRMEAVERAYQELIKRDSDASLVAEEEGNIVGLCTVEVRATLRNEALEAWIPELVVSEPSRGRGIGRALLETGIERARELGARQAVLESGAQRATALALYRSLGFEPAGSVFTLLRDR
jgi:ribosomal protein S18 acetylase RimI-like enzyme